MSPNDTMSYNSSSSHNYPLSSGGYSPRQFPKKCSDFTFFFPHPHSFAARNLVVVAYQMQNTMDEQPSNNHIKFLLAPNGLAPCGVRRNDYVTHQKGIHLICERKGQHIGCFILAPIMAIKALNRRICDECQTQLRSFQSQMPQYHLAPTSDQMSIQTLRRSADVHDEPGP